MSGLLVLLRSRTAKIKLEGMSFETSAKRFEALFRITRSLADMMTKVASRGNKKRADSPYVVAGKNNKVLCVAVMVRLEAWPYPRIRDLVVSLVLRRHLRALIKNS